MFADDDRVMIVVTAWPLLLLSLVFLVLRIWVKISRGNGLWWDDHVLVIAWALNYATAILNTLETTIGLGQHIAVVNPIYLGDLTLLGNVAGTTSILAAQLSKTSFAITLLRIATESWLRAVVWLGLITINVAMTVNMLSQWVQCTPAEKYWIPTTPGTCWPPGVQSLVSMVSAGYSGLMDIVLALLPWSIVMKLQIKRAEKIGIAAAMSLGLFAGAAAFIKAYFIPTLASGDFTFLVTELVIWSNVEIGLSIIAASIPTLRVFVRDTISSRSATKGSTKDNDMTTMSGTDTSKSMTSSSSRSMLERKWGFMGTTVTAGS